SAQLFLVIDRLSRSWKISLWSPGFGVYPITANQAQPPSGLTVQTVFPVIVRNGKAVSLPGFGFFSPLPHP
ncbi:MAG TPA: hypothetical protein VJV04_13960, partial [Nitrospiraceae bacterium]|nr:hypothetical protein [Nitrospiraceae bacterium]